jgi:hypothetical protein
MTSHQEQLPVWQRDHWQTNERSSSHDWQCGECGRSLTIKPDGTELGHALACPIVDGDADA